VDWLLDPFQGPTHVFMRQALVGGLLVATATAVVGTWVVVRGLAFLGEALGHGVLPGIALALAIGFDPVLGAALGAAVMVAGIGVVRERAGLSGDAATGLLFVGMLALGVIIISESDSVVGLNTVLFGDILSVSRSDIRLALVVVLVVVAVAIAAHRSFLALAFHPRTAAALGLHPRAADVLMLALIGATVVASYQAVGTLLVVAMLVAPPATATLLVRRVPQVMVVAVVLSWLAVLAGLLVTYHWGYAGSASIAVAAVAQFFVVLVGREAVGLARRRALAHAPSPS
jgi:ABC-type Mn2+/Zn2+ transport system permease subunit